MTVLLVVLLTAIPVAAGAVWGLRLGGRRLLAGLLLLAASWLSAIWMALLGFQLEWVWPAGLMTPLLAGLLTAACCWPVFKKKFAPAPPLASFGEANVRLDRATGSLLGMAGGFLCAVTLWLLAQLVTSLAAASQQFDHGVAGVSMPAKPQAWAHSLVRIANRGFVRHLPVAGPLGDELQAVAYILKTPIERRQEFARFKQWDALAELPTFQAIANNPQLLRDLDRVSDGNLAALYRLQCHPQVIAFVNEKPLQTMISELRASSIAEELAQFARGAE